MIDKKLILTTNTATQTPDKQSGRLKKRLREINARSEKELAVIFETIEKAKAAFRAQR